MFLRIQDAGHVVHKKTKGDRFHNASSDVQDIAAGRDPAGELPESSLLFCSQFYNFVSTRFQPFMFEILVDDTPEFRGFLSGAPFTIDLPCEETAKNALKAGAAVRVLLDKRELEPDPIPGKILAFHGPTGQLVDGLPVYSVSILMA